MIELEVNNVTSVATMNNDGSVEMSNSYNLDNKVTVDLMTNESKSSIYDKPKISLIEQMKRLSGTYYK